MENENKTEAETETEKGMGTGTGTISGVRVLQLEASRNFGGELKSAKCFRAS